MNSPSANEPGHRFVRVTAWSLLVLGIVLGLLALLQGALALVMDLAGITTLVLADPSFAYLPASLDWLFRHLLLLSLMIVALSVVSVIAGVGLLRLRHWARRLSIALMAFGAVANLAGMVFQARLLTELRDRAELLPAPLDQLIVAHYWSSQISGAVFSLVFTLGFAWTAWRLCRADVRAACA